MGRPKKQRAEGDDGRSHRIWDITDWALYDNRQRGCPHVIPERLAMWEHMSREDSCRKLMIAGEEAPDTGHWHGQCRISFLCPHRFEYVQKLFGQHCEPTVATDDWSYFKKFGSEKLIDVDHRRQGRRCIFKTQLEMIQQGDNLRAIGQETGTNGHTMRSAQLAMEFYEPERPTAKRQVHLVANDDAPMPTGIYRLNDYRFWNRYDAHLDVYIDQKDCKLTIRQLQKVCGPAPFQVGRGRQARWDHVYISGLSDEERAVLGFLPPRRLEPIDMLIRR